MASERSPARSYPSHPGSPTRTSRTCASTCRAPRADAATLQRSAGSHRDMKRILLIAVAACLLAPAAAGAATVELRFDGHVSNQIEGTFNEYTLIYRAAPGETNLLTVSGAHLVDTSAPIVPGTGCRNDGDGVSCAGDGPSEIRGDYDLGDG